MMAKRVALLSLAALGVLACSDQPRTAPTAPDTGPRLAGAISEPCSSKLGKIISDQQSGLYSGASLTQAQDLWNAVVRDCKTNLAAAQAEMMTYVQFTIDSSYIHTQSGSAHAAGTVAHWNSVFQYVAMPAPNADSTVLTYKGGAAVVTNPPVDGSTEVRTVGPYAAITIYHQTESGAPGTHLITINPYQGAGSCITGTNLTQKGPCFDFSATPRIASPGWDLPAKLGICQTESTLPGTTPGAISASLAHQPSPVADADISALVSYPSFCGHEEENPVLGSWHGGLRDILTRLAYVTRRALTPNVAFAGHTGIGGGSLLCDPNVSEFCMSPFAGVDRRIFYATFTSDAVNASPGAPERGIWTSTVKAPGSLLVQSSLGDISSNLVVLAQAGGNCSKNCGGLQLNGNVESANGRTASDGIYDITWDAIEDAPQVKGAPIVIRSTGTPGNEIARVNFVTKSSANEVYFTYNNGTSVVSTFIGNWVQHVHQSFHLIVDFTVSPATVTLVTGTGNVQGYFVDGSATNIGKISAEFTGIDSGIFGWDNISIERRPDSQ